MCVSVLRGGGAFSGRQVKRLGSFATSVGSLGGSFPRAPSSEEEGVSFSRAPNGDDEEENYYDYCCCVRWCVCHHSVTLVINEDCVR